ncbi:TolC family protein [Anaplasma bovis]|uniref:TolC family protein n=1 Tax=Anaplasma bovis TaxID=186733 RepID=UPI002FF2AC49
MRLILLSSLFLISFGAHATSLDEALSKTLSNNSSIRASMYKNLSGKREIVGTAISGILPRIDYSFVMTDTGHLSGTKKTSLITLTQPLFNGTAMLSLDKARYVHKVQDIDFAIARQKVLLDTIKAYMGVLSATEVDKLNEKNVILMREHLTAAEKRFAVGEITKTELAKAKAKYAQSKSDAVNARSKLKSVVTEYTRLVGESPTDLEYPKRKLQIPTSLEEALEMAMLDNLTINMSKNMYQAAKCDVALSVAKKLPSLTAQATETFLGKDVGHASHHLKVQLQLPIFEHGAGFIGIDRAYKAKQQSFFSMHETYKTVEALVTNAWEELIASKFLLQSVNEAVKYTEVALAAITKESELDLKTALDVLNVEQELLKAKVNLINAQNNFIINQYSLLALIGQFM